MISKIRYNKKTLANIRHDVIDLHIYRCEVYVFFPKDNEKLDKYEEWSMQGYEGGVFNYLKDHGEVWVRFKNLSYEVIAHETNHIVTMIMQSIGHPIDKEYDEPMAYLQGYIFEEIVKLAKKKKYKIK